MTQIHLIHPTEAELAAAIQENLFTLFRAMRHEP